MGLEGSLGAYEFFVTDSVSKTDEVGHGVPEKIIELVVGSSGNNTEKTRVRVAEVEGGDGGGKFVISNFLAQGGSNVLAKPAGGGERSKNGAHKCKGHGLGVRPGGTFKSECKGGRVMGIITDSVQ